MRWGLLLVAGLLAGCAPLKAPMVFRLEPEEQRKVDEVWANIFSAPDKLDRTLLLDVIICGYLYEYGVDRLHMISEKDVGDGRVVMELRYDVEQPEFDDFTVAYLDRHGREVRRERYAAVEIRERLDYLRTLHERPGTPGKVTEEQLRIQAERQARKQAIEAVLAPLEKDESSGCNEND